MTIPRQADFATDASGKQLTVTRTFDAPLNRVWDAWTRSELLDQWWAPEPYKAETRILEVKPGGIWLYAMAGPEGDRQWCKEVFDTVEPQKRISTTEMFCDEQGNENKDMPKTRWDKRFEENGQRTDVRVLISADRQEDLDTLIRMGFKEGFAMGLNNLDRLLAKQ